MGTSAFGRQEQRYPETVIPSVLCLGLIAGLFGRRGLWFVLVAALFWPITIALTRIELGVDLWVAAAAYAVLNVLAGVVVGNGVRWLAQVARRTQSRNAPGVS
jgi:hypothetical protein